MRIKLTRLTVVNGHPGVQVGEPFDCADGVAMALIAAKRAEAVTSVCRIETREPEIESRDPEPVPIRQPKRSKGKLL